MNPILKESNINNQTLKPKLSIVVICYNMKREINRTIKSLLPPYQLNVKYEDIELIIVDNGSTQQADLGDLSDKVRFYKYPEPTQSPSAAVNFGINKASSELIGVFIDGARMASPGICKDVIQARKLSERTVVSTIAYHLGPEVQMVSVFKGYNQKVEDQLLKRIDWINNGYDLFQISTLAGSSRNGLFSPISETNALFMPRTLWHELNGFDERFVSPGGGLVNLDTYKRACELKDIELVMLLSESTFHQVHGGVATNQRRGSSWQKFSKEYENIRGETFSPSQRLPRFFGSFLPQSKSLLETSLSVVSGSGMDDTKTSSLNTCLQEMTDGLIFEEFQCAACEFKMSDLLDEPIIIIGRGGSGTRLLSRLIQDIGIFLGNDLNESEDSEEWVRPIYDMVINKKSLNSQSFGKKEKEELRLNALNVLSRKGVENFKRWGFKLPETMLCLPELLDAFPKAKVIHLTRHPITLSLRRTHMTSRLDNKVGVSVLQQAYSQKGLDFAEASSQSDEINNALSWDFQLTKVMGEAKALLTENNYIVVSFEAICDNHHQVRSKLYDFLGVMNNDITDTLDIEKNRANYFETDSKYYDAVWNICSETAKKLGYSKEI
jgi:glycosyltransferase involved in cell wall biosynthesis